MKHWNKIGWNHKMKKNEWNMNKMRPKIKQEQNRMKIYKWVHENEMKKKNEMKNKDKHENEN
jgi:hypothetical protein